MGFEVTVTYYTEEARKAVQDDISLQGWIADYPDADTFAHGFLHTKEGFIGGWSGTPEVDRLSERARTETNPDIRHEIYREIEEIIKRRALLVPLFYEVFYRFARPEVENFELNFSMLNPVPYEKLWIRR
jgi:ABC-type oligopeptide transport system substrate-binding subunit